jgi:hypothetical protein
MSRIRLYNDRETLNFVKFFIDLVKKQQNNIIWVEKNDRITVLVRKKINIEGVKVISLEEEIVNSFLSINGVKKVEVNGENVTISITPNPEIYEQIYVTKFSLEKEFNLKLELKIIDI